MLITEIKGIGKKNQELLNKLGIFRVEDLLEYYPRSYDTFEEPAFVKDIDDAGVYAIYGEIAANPEIIKKGRFQIVSVIIKDYNGDGIKLIWYNMPFLKTTLKRGMRFVFRGRIVFKQGSFLMEQPKMYKYAEYDKLLSRMQPIYPLTAGVTNNLLVKSVGQALEMVDIWHEYMPFEIRQKYRLMDYSESIRKIHFPQNKEEYMCARKRIVFDEFFFFILALRAMKTENDIAVNMYPIDNNELTDNIIQQLPYKLTNAQLRVWNEIKSDLSGKKLMNRLIQGDVGSGKTIIAVLALISTVCSGYQGAFMAPTEVLAKQQYDSMTGMFKKYNINIEAALLTGSLTQKEKKSVYDRISDGTVQIVVGTNALIQEKVVFKNLALVVTDEQHRFGVNQRKALSEKGVRPHVMVMSATPIPRTLAIIIYGDLDISVIDELPANRLPIKNCVVDESYRNKAHAFIQKETDNNHQVYIICPMVEESEEIDAENVTDYSRELSEKFPKLKIECLHGKMKAEQKNDVMNRFVGGEINILVSTTVVEVGVNVPNATVMLIENADRFGLAQLHQLRGRVGRGNAQSYCIMMTKSKKPETLKRLEIMNKSNDGFYIASEDLKTRGPGDLFGIRQSGDLDFGLGDIFTDSAQLKSASECAGDFFDGKFNITAAESKTIHLKVAEYSRKCLNKLNI